MVSEVSRGLQRGLELFRDFQGFSDVLEVARGFAEAFSEPLSECHFPLRVWCRVVVSCVDS